MRCCLILSIMPSLLQLLIRYQKIPKNVTPGHGLLEKVLAIKRAGLANSLIIKHGARGRILDIGCGVIPLFLISTSLNEKYGTDPSVNDLFKNYCYRLFNWWAFGTFICDAQK